MKRATTSPEAGTIANRRGTPASSRARALVMAAVWLAVAAPAALRAGEPTGSPAAAAALDQCNALGERPPAAAGEALARARHLAEEAVTADGQDPIAHFALFCTLAKQTYVSGFSLRSLLAVRRLHREIDTTLSLAPDYTDALVAKGAFLLNLPRLLGGDARTAEDLLRRAVAAEPDRIDARLYLAEALSARDARAAAQEQARAALGIALAEDRQPEAREAQLLLARLER
jgi:hypothetical protein